VSREIRTLPASRIRQDTTLSPHFKDLFVGHFLKATRGRTLLDHHPLADSIPIRGNGGLHAGDSMGKFENAKACGGPTNDSSH
jgi:hypothetical protein